MRNKQAETIVKQVIDEYALVVNRVQYINMGGCGMFAEYLYITLKNLGLKPSIAIIGRNAENIKEVIHNNRTPNEIYFWSHIVIYVGGMYLDSSGIRVTASPDIKRYPDVVKGMSLELLKEWNNIPHYWNPTFNRHQRKYIKCGFKEIEKKVAKNLEVRKKRLTFA